MCQISNKYLQAVRKKVWKTIGTEWGQTDMKTDRQTQKKKAIVPSDFVGRGLKINSYAF